MSFAETYSEEVIETRRIRAQRARFWARIVSLMLMITVAATLHSEPRLRAALMTAAINGVMALTGGSFVPVTSPENLPEGAERTIADPDAVMKLLRELQPGNIGDKPSPAPASPDSPVAAPAPTETIKVNRFGNNPEGSGPQFRKVGQPAAEAPAGPASTTDPQSTTLDFENLLQRITGGS
ncbi:hypothetical protein AB2B41_14495 [Marimonas sp. MJW-29]|uniref:Uncharacterized protein n=1 Tax=Sulfitobacter sediminis TaxID=3234186 RepID=A0ABV3RPC4_9RHOB